MELPSNSSDDNNKSSVDINPSLEENPVDASNEVEEIISKKNVSNISPEVTPEDLVVTEVTKNSNKKFNSASFDEYVTETHSGIVEFLLVRWKIPEGLSKWLGKFEISINGQTLFLIICNIRGCPGKKRPWTIFPLC